MCFLHEETANWRCNHRTKQECWWIIVLLLHMLEEDGKKLLLAATTIRHLTQKKTFSLCLPTIHCAAAVYFSCFSLSSALIQSSFFNVISVKLLPFGKIRSLAGASGCAVSIEPYPSSSRSLPSLISKVSLKITSGGKVFKRHRKTWLLDEIKKWCWLLLLCNRFLPPTRRCTK